MFWKSKKAPADAGGETAVSAAVQPAAPATWVPPGHFYSPIADLDDLRAREDVVFDLEAPFPDVDLRPDAQRALWDKIVAQAERFTIATTQNEAAAAGQRYYADNDQFGPGDATTYAAMLLEHKPKRLIEVGSGFSSALFLDINAKFFGGGITPTFIEPYPDRLMRLLSDEDKKRTRLLLEPVQNVPLSVYGELESGDVLFVDSRATASLRVKARGGGDEARSVFAKPLSPSPYRRVEDGCEIAIIASSAVPAQGIRDSLV